MEHVVMFSGGAGSYCAAKRVIEANYPERVVLLFADTNMEDPDLYRFLNDAAGALGVPVTRIADGRNPWDVFRAENFLGNSRIDPCSKILKRKFMDKWVQEKYPDPNGVRLYVGIDWTEEHRFTRMAPRKLPYVYEAPMCEAPYLLKPAMLEVLAADGVKPPALYALGFPHNNCGGFCVKAGIAHFQLLLEKLPHRYRWHEEQEQAIQHHLGRPVTILRRQVRGDKTPLPLRQLREEIEAGKKLDESEKFDFGGCGCAIDEPIDITDLF